MKSHKYKKALITGASLGIGEALARLLAREGIELILVARSVDKLEALAKELPVKVEVFPCDLSQKEQRRRLVELVHRQVPDLVVNNAGFGYYGEALSYTTDQLMEMVEVDVSAVLELSLEAARALVASSTRGVVLNVSSAAAFQIFPCFAVYAASKAFVNRFSESFDDEVRGQGVRVLAACPGMVDTHFRYRASGDPKQSAHPLAMTAEFAAEEIWKQIQMKKVVRIFDWKYRFATFLSRYLVPKRFLTLAMRKSVENRYPSRPLILK